MIHEKYRWQWKQASKNSYSPAPKAASLRARRLKRGCGLRELARLSGVSHSHLVNVENGTRNVTSETAGRISAALETKGGCQ